MRWTIGGPDLPPELLQAQEDGRLVFFCGAGVSYRAGWIDPKLREILSTIQSARPELRETPEFRALDEILLMRGGP